MENLKEKSINKKKKNNKSTKKENTTKQVERTKGPRKFVTSKTSKLLNKTKPEPKKETKKNNGPITYTVKKHKRNKQ